jgi:hypothetical protein
VLSQCLNESAAVEEDALETFLRKYALSFWYDSIRTMHQVNQKCTRPLMLWHMLLEYRGLSRIGQQIGSAVGANLPESTYRRLKKDMLQMYDAKLIKMLESNSAVVTIDNFCKSWGNPTLSMNRPTQYINTNFTVNALCAITDAPPEGFPLKALDVKNDLYLPSIPPQLKELAYYGKEV